MNGSKLFTTATALTMVALLGFMAAGFFPILVDFAFGIEGVALILALIGLTMLVIVTVRKALEKAAQTH